jgi:ribose transport system permease protein
MSIAQQLWRRVGLQLIILVLVVVGMMVMAPDFVGQPAAFSVLERLVPLGIITAGLAATMIVGELDLSVASMAALSGAIAIQLGNTGLALLPVVLLATLIGVVVGTLQGWVVARLGLSSLVLTVGTLILLRGATWLATGGVPITMTNFAMSDQLLTRIWLFSPLSITTLLVMAALGVFLSRTRPGRSMYAIGGGRTEAVAAGVPLRRSIVLAFAICGGCGALAGALSSVRSGSVTPDAFTNQLLLGVAAALVGGIGLAGGRGGMLNVLLGVVITSTLAAGLSSLGVKAYVSELFTGVLLLAVIGVDAMMRWVAHRRNLNQHREQLAGFTTTRERVPEPAASR